MIEPNKYTQLTSDAAEAALELDRLMNALNGQVSEALDRGLPEIEKTFQRLRRIIAEWQPMADALQATDAETAPASIAHLESVMNFYRRLQMLFDQPMTGEMEISGRRDSLDGN